MGPLPRPAATTESSSAATSHGSSSTSVNPVRPANMPRQRSRGQLARRHSTTNAGRPSAASLDRRHSGGHVGRSRSKRRSSQKNDGPFAGGLYVTDILFVGLTYGLNLIRTCGVAELADVAFKGALYVVGSLPLDFYQRWTLSNRARRQQQATRAQRAQSHHAQPNDGSDSDARETDNEAHHRPSVEPEAASDSELGSPAQLSPFHHLILLLTRFACANFPHLVPRVLFAEETIGPFVYWRTGGGSNAVVQEFTDLWEVQQRAAIESVHNKASGKEQEKLSDLKPSFRAFWISKDARLPIEVQRSNMAARGATTVLYLHGGGFSLGSVAFYAEALLRLRAKICNIESEAEGGGEVDARCVAVEYELSPTSRFPGPLLQCLRCYAHLIEVEHIEPSSICVAGDSAGGNLTMGMLLALSGQCRGDPLIAERDWSELPLPGKAVLISPWVDLRPSSSHAFSNLRTSEEGPKTEAASASKQREQHGDKQSKAAADLTARISAYEWDYVASETLLHFAQVYAGVMPYPRRVRGPLGWIAHICGVIASDEGQEANQHNEGKSPTPSGFMGMPRVFSVLARPSRRIARATHSILTDPVFSQLNAATASSKAAAAAAQNEGVVTRNTGTLTGLEPIFPETERKTELVADRSQLYVPFGDETHDSARAVRASARASSSDARSESEAMRMLETHPLISPAVGDWSNIQLEHGIFVTWGERERLATDIEAWVQKLRSYTSRNAQTFAQSESDEDDDDDDDERPGQDGAHSKRAGRSRSFVTRPRRSRRSSDDWVHTVVERGPGGVHAWPFVSMYLAGSEEEREKGLDVMARFIARPRKLPDLQVGLEYDDDEHGGDASDAPPHTLPESPLHSPGSMPSDIDLHGVLDDGEEEQRGRRAMSMAEAVARVSQLNIDANFGSRQPQEGYSSGEEGSDNSSLTAHGHHRPTHGLGLSGHRRPQTPDQQGDVLSDEGHQTTPRMAASTLRSASRLGSNPDPPASQPQPVLRTVQLHRPGAPRAAPTTASAQSAATEMSISPPVRGRPTATTTGSLWWQSAAASSSSTIVPSPSDERLQLSGESEDELADDLPPHILDNIEEVSNEAFSPDRSLSPPADEDASASAAARLSAMQMSQPIPMDPSFYGLSHYTFRRPEPEGLSDITEEDSNLSASFTSGRGLSPVGGQAPWAAPLGERDVGGSRDRSPAGPIGEDAMRAAMRQRERDWRAEMESVERFSTGMRAVHTAEGEEAEDEEDDDEDEDEPHEQEGDWSQESFPPRGSATGLTPTSTSDIRGSPLGLLRPSAHLGAPPSPVPSTGGGSPRAAVGGSRSGASSPSPSINSLGERKPKGDAVWW